MLATGAGEHAGAAATATAGEATAAHPWKRARTTALLAASAAIETTVPRWPVALTLAVQRRRIAAIARHAYDTVPFYRDAMRALGLTPASIARVDDLARLPLIDDEIVQANPDAFISTACPRDQRTALLTSGSSRGVRRMIAWDHAALLKKTASAQRDRRVLNVLAGERLAATLLREFAGRGESAAQRSLAGLLSADGGHGRLSILPLDHTSQTQRTFLSRWTLVPPAAGNYSLLSPAEGHAAAVDALERRRPRVVFSFGSYVEEFFAYLDASGRDVPLPRVWVYMGDCVGTRGGELARERGCALFSVYASAEGGAIGFQCEHQEGFHLNVDLCAVRIADDDGATLAAGQTGEIVISNLQNHAMVLLNYRQGDHGALATGPCACGRRLPLLQSLAGRRSDVVQTADGVRLSALEIEGLFRGPLRTVSQCQLSQREPGQLTWRLICRPGADREIVRDAMLERGRTVLGETTRLEIEFPDQLDKSPSGKLLRVTS